LLGEEDGKEVKFYVNVSNPFGNSRYKEMGWSGADEVFPEHHNRTLLTERLDTVVSRLGLPLPDFVKMDVQGSEWAVVGGGRETLTHASHLLVELQVNEYNRGAPGKAATEAAVEALGFALAARSPEQTSNDNSGYTNDYLFVKQ
jgi:hypothetical protein